MSKFETESERAIDRIKRYITKILRDAGAYDATLGYQIELVATDIYLFRSIRRSLFDSIDKQMTIKEESREGKPRLKPNPMIFQLREQSKVVAKNLDALLMNVKSKKDRKQAEDSLSEFMKSMSDDDEK
jgi:hypothetical protein